MAYPDPRDYVDLTKTQAQRDRLADYLDAGKKLARWCDNSWCRFCGCNTGGYTLGDDRLVWPCGLGHYVRHHRVWIPGVLPEEG